MTTFTDTWNAAFNTTPSDSEVVSLGASRMRETRLGVKERLEVDHSWAGDADDGAHKKLTLVEQASDPGSVANRGFLYAKDVSTVTELFYQDSAGSIQQITSAGVLSQGAPVGSVIDYAGLTEPTGWLFCYGQAISRTTYAALFAVVSTTYGVGDGSTTFNLPDLRGRVVAGQDDMGGTSANRLTNQSGGLNGDTLGATGGAETHTLVSNEMPAHTHTIPVTVSETNAGAAGSTTAGATAGVTGSTGGGAAHNNVQPTIILNKIIKT